MNTIKQLLDKYCPDGVEYKKLGEMCERIKGTPITAAIMKQIQVENGDIRIFAGGKTFINTNEEKIPNANITRVPAVIVQSRGIIDFIFYDKPFTFKNEMWAYTNSNIFTLRYIYYFLKTKVRSLRTTAAKMGSMPQISIPSTEKIEVPVPPLPVQREIVRILDNFTSLEAELEAELEARRKQYEYYRDQLLSFKHLSAGGKNKVEWKTLGEIGEVCMCKRIMKNQTNAEGCIPFYKIGTFGKKADAFISEELYQEYKQKYSFPRKGEVLISAAGTIGRAVIYDGMPAYFQDSNIVWIANDESLVLNKYLYYFYSVADWRLEGGTIKRLYNNNLKAVKIPIPPLSTQRRIVSILDRFESLVNDISTGLPAEIAARHQQYEYYRDQLLSFKRK